MKRRALSALILGFAIVLGVFVIPLPCAACSAPIPPTERITLELASVSIDGVTTPPDSSYVGFDTYIQAGEFREGIVFGFSEGPRRARGYFFP